MRPSLVCQSWVFSFQSSLPTAYSLWPTAFSVPQRGADEFGIRVPRSRLLEQHVLLHLAGADGHKRAAAAEVGLQAGILGQRQAGLVGEPIAVGLERDAIAAEDVADVAVAVGRFR